MNTFRRSVMSLGLAGAFAAAAGASALLGRGIAGPLAAVQLAGSPPDVLDYGLLDIDRGLMSRTRVTVPRFDSARFQSAPALVLQADRRDDVTAWTLSELDVASGRLTPQVELTTPRAARLNFTHFVAGEDESWRVYSFSTGQIYYSPPRQREAQPVTVPGADRHSQALIWSPDGARTAIISDGTIILGDAAGRNGRAVLVGDVGGSALSWSPDGRYVVTSWGGWLFSVPSAVVDTQTGEVVARIEAVRASWCGSRVLYITTIEDGVYAARLLDPATGSEETVLSRDLSQYASDARQFMVVPLDQPNCQWYALSTVGGGFSAFYLPTQTHIPLGINAQTESMAVENGAMTIRVSIPYGTELRRVVLDPPAASAEVLAITSSRSTTVTWLDDTRGALNLAGDVLSRIDPSGTETALTPPGVLAFFIVAD